MPVDLPQTLSEVCFWGWEYRLLWCHLETTLPSNPTKKLPKIFPCRIFLKTYFQWSLASFNFLWIFSKRRPAVSVYAEKVVVFLVFFPSKKTLDFSDRKAGGFSPGSINLARLA